MEIVKLHQQGWSKTSMAGLLRCMCKRVRKWIRCRQQAPNESNQQWLIELSSAPHQPQRKVYFGAFHAVLILHKKYGYAVWFCIKGYLESEYKIYLSPTTIKKIMALNRRIHLVPQRPVTVIEPHEIREGPKKSRQQFEHIGLSRFILAGTLTTDQEDGVLLHLYF